MANIMISAGEASGDLHGARLATALLKNGEHQIYALGSDKLRQAGATLLYDCKDIAVVGLVEVLRHYPKIKAALKLLQQALIERQIALLIVIDYVEFNLKLAAFAKARGIKVLFYVSPQVWAWRQGRVPKIGACIDHMAVILPFETEIYQQHHIPVTYVGHPLAGKVVPSMPKAQFKKAHHLSDAPLIALMPGSRHSEVTRLLPIMLQTVKILNARHNWQFVLALAPTVAAEDVQLVAEFNRQTGIGVQVIRDQTYDVINAASAVLVASGTATLEVALCNVPMSVLYQTNPLSYAIFKRLIALEDICLVNIISGRRVVPEFIQAALVPADIAAEVERQVGDLKYRQQIISALFQLRQKLGTADSAAQVAAIATALLK